MNKETMAITIAILLEVMQELYDNEDTFESLIYKTERVLEARIQVGLKKWLYNNFVPGEHVSVILKDDQEVKMKKDSFFVSNQSDKLN